MLLLRHSRSEEVISVYYHDVIVRSQETVGAVLVYKTLVVIPELLRIEFQISIDKKPSFINSSKKTLRSRTIRDKTIFCIEVNVFFDRSAILSTMEVSQRSQNKSRLS